MKKTFKTFALMLLTAFAFSSCVDVPAPYNLPDDGSNSGNNSSGTTIEPQGDGTAASPFNVAAAVAKIKEMEAGVESTEEYYIKGKVLAVKTDQATITQYGNHTFTMVDEGSTSPVFTAFQVYGPGKKKFTSVDDIKVGDEVVVCGKVVNYKGNTPETVGKGAAYVVSINASDDSGGGDQGDIQHISIAEFLERADPNTTYELTGVVRNIVNTLYGNFDLVEGDAKIYIYGLLDLNGAPKQFESLGIAEGDVVTLTGKYLLFNNKPEISNAQFVSVVKDGGGGSSTTDSSKENPLTVTQAMSASGNNYVKGYIVGYIDGMSLATGATFGVPSTAETEILLAETPDETSPDNVFPVQLPAGDIRNALELSAHSNYLKQEVLLYGSVEKYFGVTGMKGTSWVSIDGNTYGTDPEGGDTPIGDIQHITIAEFLEKADPNTTYELTGTVSNIANTTYGNFDLVEGEASIYIYGLLDLNGEAKKFESLNIAEGDVVTLTGKYFLYNDKPEIKNAQFVSVVKGDGGGGDTPGPGGDPVTDLVNGDFESWVSASELTGWKPSAGTGPGNATYSQSTDAHGGAYACLVAAPGSTNKRLATQEITLEAGSYTFSFYAKCTTGDKSQTRAGYVPMKADGTPDTYKYGDYIDLNSSEWTLVSYDFELTSTTTLCLLVMNPKGSSYSVSQDILVDDATLVKH